MERAPPIRSSTRARRSAPAPAAGKRERLRATARRRNERERGGGEHARERGELHARAHEMAFLPRAQTHAAPRRRPSSRARASASPCPANGTRQIASPYMRGDKVVVVRKGSERGRSRVRRSNPCGVGAARGRAVARLGTAAESKSGWCVGVWRPVTCSPASPVVAQRQERGLLLLLCLLEKVKTGGGRSQSLPCTSMGHTSVHPSPPPFSQQPRGTPQTPPPPVVTAPRTADARLLCARCQAWAARSATPAPCGAGPNRQGSQGGGAGEGALSGGPTAPRTHARANGRHRRAPNHRRRKTKPRKRRARRAGGGQSRCAAPKKAAPDSHPHSSCARPGRHPTRPSVRIAGEERVRWGRARVVVGGHQVTVHR